MATRLNDFGYQFGSTDQVLVADTIIADPAKIKALYGQTTAASPYSTAKIFGTNTAYVVPAGKKYVLVALQTTSDGNSSGLIIVGHGSNDIGFNSSSTPTTFTSAALLDIVSTNGAFQMSCLISIPAGAYVYSSGQTGTTTQFTFYGYEIDEDATSI